MSTYEKKPINAIFGDMDYSDDKSINSVSSINISGPNFEIPLIGEVSKLRSFYFDSLEKAVQNASDTDPQWSAAASVIRADFLLNIFFQGLTENSKKFIKNNFIKENEFFLGLDYINYYSSIATLTDTYRYHTGIVFLSLNNAPFYIVTAAVSAALVAGNSVILQTDNRISLCLSYIFSECKISKGCFNVVTKPVDSKDLTERIKAAIFFGSHLAAQEVYLNSSCSGFSFLCPNNTSAIILESCDISAAVHKIVSETWDPDCASMWAVSTAVVQESIYKTFLEKLKFRIKKLKEEKKNHPKFKNEIICRKIIKITTEAIQAGAVVEESSNKQNEWGPTVIVHYQNQQTELDVPVLNVLICRTAKEGVALLNNSRHCLGTSIWTEVSPQALQIGSMLVCKNIWVNCHGLIDPSIPLLPDDFSGNCIFGGQDGLFEFLFFNFKKSKKTDPNIGSDDKVKALETAQNANNAFSKWVVEKNKVKYCKDVANSLKNQIESMEWFDICLNAKLSGLSSGIISPTNQTDFEVVQRKVPIGVIAIYVDTCENSILSVLIPAIILGNAVILVVRHKNQYLESLLKIFNKFFPKNLFSVLFGQTALFCLLSDPNVATLWLCDEQLSPENFREIKRQSEKSLKPIWIMSSNSPCFLIEKRCLKNQIIWLSKIDQFP